MNPKLAHLLTRLYPSAWRKRYGEEFQTFLELGPSNVRIAMNVVWSALYERVSLWGGFGMTRIQQALILMMYGCLTAITGGVNLYWTVDDNPLVAAMQTHFTWFASWNVIGAGSILMFIAVSIMGLPIFLAIFRFAYAAQRRDIMLRLAFPPCAAALVILWFAAVLFVTGGHWVPLPWAVAGNGPGWPPVDVRWLLGFITLVLLIVALVASAITLKQAISRSECLDQVLRNIKIPGLVVAGSIVIMVAGVVVWGLFANQYAQTDFYAHSGGLLDMTTFNSWTISLVLFVVSSGAVFRSTRHLLAHTSA